MRLKQEADILSVMQDMSAFLLPKNEQKYEKVLDNLLQEKRQKVY